MRTCFEEVLEDTDAVSLFFGFFKLDLSSLETPLPVEVVDPKDNVELNVEFKLSILPP
jgi:hypothetical protein